MSRIAVQVVLGALLIAVFARVHGQQDMPVTTTVTPHQETLKQASVWGLSESEWSRYEQLKRGQRQYWSPNADPVSVLGAHAATDKERQRYAEMLVMMEYRRVEQELAFETAVQTAWRKLFPGRLRVGPTLASTDINTLVKERFALVVDKHCETRCQDLLTKHIALLVKNTAIEALDIYVVNDKEESGADSGLLEFIRENSVPLDLIQNRRITINDGARYKDVSRPGVWKRKGDGTWVAL